MSDTFDLNDPKDAREYVIAWVEQDRLAIDDDECRLLTHGTDEDFLLTARQLFLYCDPRKVQGAHEH